MTRRALASTMLAFLLGCGHSTVANDQPAQPVKEAARATPRTAPRAADSKTLPLSTSPAGQLAPDGLAAIKERLRATGQLSPARADESAGLDDATQRALRAFQGSKNLPETGVPDESTVRALGLDPARIFRHAP